MRLLLIPWLVVTAFGAGALAVSGYLIVRGPFLGGVPLGSRALVAALIVFMAGLIVTALGGTKAARLVIGY